MSEVFLAPTAVGYPGAPELAQAPGVIAPLLDLASDDVQWLDTSGGSCTEVAGHVSRAVSRSVAGGNVPVIVGGDHTVAVGGVMGVDRGLRERSLRRGPSGAHVRGANEPNPAVPALFLLWLDAHPDVNDATTSPTGHLHGMVLRGLLGEGPLAVAEPLPPERVVLAGVRSFDPGELAFLQARPEMALWDVDVLRGDGWQQPLNELIRRVRREGGRIYLSLDLDVFDPAWAPGVAVPARNGAHVEPVVALISRLRQSGLLAGADVVELYPPADDGRTAALAARLVEGMHAVAAHMGHRVAA